jgi:hypothetical protein
MAFSVKNRTNGELLRWARGRGRVMRGYVDLEKPSVKALGQTGDSRMGERCPFDKKGGFYPPRMRDFEPAVGLNFKPFWV